MHSRGLNGAKIAVGKLCFLGLTRLRACMRLRVFMCVRIGTRHNSPNSCVAEHLLGEQFGVGSRHTSVGVGQDPEFES